VGSHLLVHGGGGVGRVARGGGGSGGEASGEPEHNRRSAMTEPEHNRRSAMTEPEHRRSAKAQPHRPPPPPPAPGSYLCHTERVLRFGAPARRRKA
jgi:hypothetical protein